MLFAGEATHDTFFSHVTGAVDSGYREAARINAYYPDTPSVPSPASGILISAQHLLALRTSMNNALVSLGIPVNAYTDPNLTGLPIRALHIQELQARAK